MMNNSQVFFRSGLIALIVLLFVVPVSAWTFSGWTGPANGAELAPGSAVRAGYTLSFSSFESGKTFDPDNSLVMYTDLTDPHWVVIKSEEVNEELMTTTLADRQSAQVRLSGWDLSFSRKQFTVNVAVTGTMPLLNESGEINILRLQELDPEAKTVQGSLMKKTAFIVVPTTVPTPLPTVEQEEELLIESTPVPVATTVTTVKPAKKQTYAPGPDSVMVCSVLAGAVLIAGITRRRH
jgi:hypothetical protein